MNDKVPDTSNWKSSEVGGMCFSNGLQIHIKFYFNYQLQKTQDCKSSEARAGEERIK